MQQIVFSCWFRGLFSVCAPTHHTVAVASASISSGCVQQILYSISDFFLCWNLDYSKAGHLMIPETLEIPRPVHILDSFLLLFKCYLMFISHSRLILYCLNVGSAIFHQCNISITEATVISRFSFTSSKRQLAYPFPPPTYIDGSQHVVIFCNTERKVKRIAYSWKLQVFLYYLLSSFITLCIK